MNLPDQFESVRKYLGWSLDLVSKKSGDKYSPKFLKQMHAGRPSPEVEEDVTEIYILGLAERAVDSALDSQSHHGLLGEFVNAFVRVVRQRQLPLEGVASLVKRASTTKIFEARLRGQTVVDDIRIWEEALKTISLELNGYSWVDQSFGSSLLGTEIAPLLLEVADSEDTPDLPSPHNRSVYQHTQPNRQSEQLIQCPQCDMEQLMSQGSQCGSCGNRSIFNPNW